MDLARIGPYLILDKLGEGGMGTVYLGRNQETNLIAAVKVLPAALAREDGFVERFHREMQSMKKLSNPHTVRFYDSGEDAGTWYFAMEYVAGETLMSALRRERKIEWRRAVDISMQVCQAIKAAHDAGIIHRDLKPSNLLITQDGSIKLTDFGVAQLFAADRLTVTGGIIGTAEYMSPEQAQGKRATMQSDLYSLGAVLYCMVTGRPPFGGETAIDVIQKHKFGRFDPPRLYSPEIPAWLDELICQLLEKDPNKRPHDALVLLRRFETELRREQAQGMTLAENATYDPQADTLASNVPASGPGPGTLMRSILREELDSKSWIERQLEKTWLLVTLLGLVVVAGLWFWYARRPPENTSLVDVASESSASLAKLRLIAASSRRLMPDSDAQRWLLVAQQQWLMGRADDAQETLRSLIILVGNAEDYAAEVALAKKLLTKLEQESFANDRAFVDGALKRAAELAKNNRIVEARAIWTSLVTLYADQPDFAKQVTLARRHLTETETENK